MRPFAAVLLILLAACESPAAIEPSTTPSAAVPTESLPSPSAVQSPSAQPGSWTLSATFDTEGAAEQAIAVVPWGDGFVAIGHGWEGGQGFTANPPVPRVWTSADGLSWREQQAAFGANDVSLIGLAPLADGRLLAVGRVGFATGDPPPRSVGWVSSDAQTWDAVDLPVADGMAIDSLAYGAKGFAFTAGGDLWFSPDGLAWMLTYDDGAAGVVAGNDGFVAIQIPAAGAPWSVVASGDGWTWYPSGPLADAVLDIGALRGDWLATGYSAEFSTISVWHSTDGLEWTPVLDVNDLTLPDGPKAGQGMQSGITEASLASAGGQAFLTLAWNHCCAQLAGGVGVWTSTDGVTWSAAIGTGAFVTSAATDGTVTALAGHLGRGTAAAFWSGQP